VDGKGNPLVDSSLIILLNSNPDSVKFKMPELKAKWQIEVDTGAPDIKLDERMVNSSEIREVAGRSVVLLKQIA